MNAIILTPNDFDRFSNEMKAELYKNIQELKALVVEKPMGVKEAADYLRIAERTLYTWLSNNTIPAKYVHRLPNGSVYFLPSELHAFIKNS